MKTKEAETEFPDFESVSSTECTGLFARAPQNDYEYDSYFDVMTFSPKDFKSEENSRRHHFVH